jgi:hypothetical protein
MSQDLRKELRLKLLEKKIERTCKSGRNFLEKKIKNSNETEHGKRILHTIREKNEDEFYADNTCENFLTD